MNSEPITAQGPVDGTVSCRDWRKDYQDAYRAANGHEAEIVDDGRGWYKIKTQDVFQTGCRYQRWKILKMTVRLLERSATANAEVTGRAGSAGEGPR